MIYTIIDIETSGLMKFDENADLIPDLLEFSFLQVDSTTLRIVKNGTLWFYQPHFDIENEAQEIHHIQRDFLMKYEDQFEENLIALASIMTNATVMGKNSRKFDVPFIWHFIKKYKGNSFDIGDITMRLAMKTYDGHGRVFHENNTNHIDIQEIYAPVYRVKTYLKEMGRIGEFYSPDFTANKFENIHDTYCDKRKRGKLTEYIEMMPNGYATVNEIYNSLPKDISTGAHGGLYDAVMTYVIWLDYIILKGRLK